MIQTFEHNPEIQTSSTVEMKAEENLKNFNQFDKIQTKNEHNLLNVIHLNLHSANHRQFHRETIRHLSLNPYQLSQNTKRTPPKTVAEVFMQVKKILKKPPQIRTPSENQVILQLLSYNEFLSDLVQNVSLQCFKGLMKQAKIQEVKQRQLIFEQGKTISHMVVLLDGKLGICKEKDDLLPQPQRIKTPPSKPSAKRDIDLPSAQKQGKQKQLKPIQPIIPIDNIFDELTVLSCKQIQTIKKKNSIPKRKSIVPQTSGLVMPLPYSKQKFSEYEIDTFVNPGEQYGADVRCRSKTHPHSVFAIEKSILLIIEFHSIIYWFEHSFRVKIGARIEKLKKIPAFSFLQDAILAECILHMHKEKRKRNDFIYKQGSPSQKLYILISGEIKLSKEAKLFEQNPNELYVDRRKLMHMSTNLTPRQEHTQNVQILPYANLTTLYNFRPMRKNIDLGIVTSNTECFSLLGEEEMIEKKPRETNAQVISFDCEFYQILIKKLEEILGPKLMDDFYAHSQKTLKKVILYRQNQYAGKVNLENRQNLDYFYYENDKSKESPRKYKLQKINNKFSGHQTHQTAIKTLPIGGKDQKFYEQAQMKPFYTTFNFHKLMRTERLTHSRKLSQRENKANSSRKMKESLDSTNGHEIKFDPVEEHLIDISHTWKPIKKKVIQEIKVMQKISKKKHSININESLIEQQYFKNIQKEQKRIDRQHKIFKLSLGKRTKW